MSEPKPGEDGAWQIAKRLAVKEEREGLAAEIREYGERQRDSLRAALEAERGNHQQTVAKLLALQETKAVDPDASKSTSWAAGYNNAAWLAKTYDIPRVEAALAAEREAHARTKRDESELAYQRYLERHLPGVFEDEIEKREKRITDLEGALRATVEVIKRGELFLVHKAGGTYVSEVGKDRVAMLESLLSKAGHGSDAYLASSGHSLTR